MMMIDTSSGSKSKLLKLTDDEEKSIKLAVKFKEESEGLLRIFRLMN